MTHDFVFGAVEHPLQRWVRCRKDAVEAGRSHAGGRRLEHSAPTLLARAQRRFRMFAIGDVDGHHGKKGRRRVRRGYQRGADVRPYDCTVLASITFFEPIAALRTSDEATEKSTRLGLIVLMREFEYGKVQSLAFGISEHSLECRIHANNTAIQIARCDADR